MKMCEVRAVKRILGNYQDYLEMAEEKDRESVLLADKLYAVGIPSGVSSGSEGTGAPRPRASVYNGILSDQLEADRKATEYRQQASRIRAFIASIDDDRKHLLEDVYLEGRRYEDVARERGYSISAVKMAITRCLTGVPSKVAQASGLI